MDVFTGLRCIVLRLLKQGRSYSLLGKCWASSPSALRHVEGERTICTLKGDLSFTCSLTPSHLAPRIFAKITASSVAEAGRDSGQKHIPENEEQSLEATESPGKEVKGRHQTVLSVLVVKEEILTAGQRGSTPSPGEEDSLLCHRPNCLKYDFAP